MPLAVAGASLLEEHRPDNRLAARGAVRAKTKQVPPLDDRFAKLLGAESLELLRARVREDLTRELTAQARRAAEEQVIAKLG